MNSPVTPHGGGAHTAGPWTTQGWVPTWAYIPVKDIRHNLICAMYPDASHGYSRAEVEANARLIAAAPDYDAAAGPAITALSFAQERALNERDEIAFKQITAAKAGLIAAMAKARGGYDALNIVEGEVVEPRASIAKATP